MLDFGGESEKCVGIDIPPGVEIPVYWARDGITHNVKRARRMAYGKVVLWARCGTLVHNPERVTEDTQKVLCIGCLGAL